MGSIVAIPLEIWTLLTVSGREIRQEKSLVRSRRLVPTYGVHLVGLFWLPLAWNETRLVRATGRVTSDSHSRIHVLSFCCDRIAADPPARAVPAVRALAPKDVS